VIRWVRRSTDAVGGHSDPWPAEREAHAHEAGKLMSIGMTDWTAKPLSRHHLADKIVHLLPGFTTRGCRRAGAFPLVASLGDL
jgi:hypothetical protein